MLLPQTLDISYSGVHGNKKFPTVEGPEVVRWGKGLTWLGLGVEASRKFYFGILFFPVPERIEPAHMWIREQAQSSGNLFSDAKFSGDIFAGAKGLAAGLGGLGWKGGCPGNSAARSKMTPGGFETAQLSKGAAAPPLSCSGFGLKGNTHVKRTSAFV